MKKLIIILFVLPSFFFGQERFTLTKDGFKPKEQIVTVENISAKDIYTRSIKYIKQHYKNPDEVIRTTIENEMIRFSGYTSEGTCWTALGSKNCASLSYTIQIDIKDGKYKINIITASTNPTFEPIFKSTGELRNRKGADVFKSELENSLSNVFVGIHSAILNENKDNW